jgi:hypothetical protein
VAGLNYQIVIGAKDNASPAMAKLGRSIDNAARNAAKLTAAFAAVGGAVTAAVISQVKVIDSLAKTARAAGVSAESLQELRFAADRSGVSSEQLDDGLRRLNRRLGEFINSGGGPAAAAFERLGISAEDSSGKVKSTETVFNEIVASLEGVESQAQKAALASQLFGDDAGPKLALLLAEGSAGVAALREEQERLGQVTNEQAAEAEAAADALTNFETATNALAQSFALELVPTLTKVANFLANNLGRVIEEINLLILRLRMVISETLGAITAALSKLLELNEKIRSNVARTLSKLPGVALENVGSFEKFRGVLAEVSDALLDTSDIADTELQQALLDLQERTDGLGESFDGTKKSASGLSDELENSGESIDRTRRKADQLSDGLGESEEAIEEVIVTAQRLDGALAGGGSSGGTATGLVGALLIAGDSARRAAKIFGTEVKEEAEEGAQAVENWAQVVDVAFRNVEGRAGEVGRAIAGVIGLFQQIQGQGGGLTSFGNVGLASQLFQGASIGGFVGQALGVSQSGQVGAQIGGALGGLIPGLGPIGSLVGSAIGGIFGDDEGERIQRFQLLTGRATSAAESGADPRFFRRTALGLGIQGQRITEALGDQSAQAFLDAAVQVDAFLANIARNTDLASIESLADAINPNRATGDVSREFIGETPEALAIDRLNRALGGFDQRVQRLVGTITDAEEGFRRIQAAVQVIETVNLNPIEEAEEILRRSSLSVTESLRELGEEFITQTRTFDGSTASLEALAGSAQAFQNAAVQALLQIEQVRQRVGDITGATIDQLRFSAIGDPGAQLDFLIGRATQLSGEIGGLGSASAVEQQIQLINQLISQAGGLAGTEALQGGLLDQLIGILQQAEEAAQSRLDVIEQETQSVVDDTLSVIRNELAGAATSFNEGASAVAAAGGDFSGAVTTFAGGVDRFVSTPILVDVSVSGFAGEVNQAA